MKTIWLYFNIKLICTLEEMALISDLPLRKMRTMKTSARSNLKSYSNLWKITQKFVSLCDRLLGINRNSDAGKNIEIYKVHVCRTVSISNAKKRSEEVSDRYSKVTVGQINACLEHVLNGSVLILNTKSQIIFLDILTLANEIIPIMI